jgi:hypothetical protein
MKGGILSLNMGANSITRRERDRALDDTEYQSWGWGGGGQRLLRRGGLRRERWLTVRGRWLSGRERWLSGYKKGRDG